MIEKFDIFKDKINNCYQVRTKTQSYSIVFDNKEKEEIFMKVINEITKKPEISLKKLKARVENKENKEKVLDVLKTLSDYGLITFNLLSDSETKKDSYQYETKERVINSISIFGKDDLAKEIEFLAKKESFEKVYSYPFEEKLDIEAAVKKSEFIIVSANDWAPYYIEKINLYALKYNKPWLYIGGIEEISIKIGPLFYGKETGCYNCLISRIKSNHEYPEHLQSYETFLREKKIASKPDIVPNVNIIYSIIASLTMLEVMRFIEEWSLPVTWRTVIVLNIFDYDLSKHALLKIPFCEACKPKLEYNPAPWLEEITLK
mgnify:CR=1 FL=1